MAANFKAYATDTGESMSTLRKEKCTAFENLMLIAQGTPSEVRAELKKLRSQREVASVLVFDDETGEDFDLEGDKQFAPEAAASGDPATLQPATADDPAPKSARPGRPKLGVIPREVTLLPRHWEWLESQPGGASVALRKLVETARKDKAPEDRARRSIEATYRFLSVICGNMSGFEDTARALFRRNWAEFDRLSEAMPRDIGSHLKKLSESARLDYATPSLQS
jgi:hypothetical protein